MKHTLVELPGIGFVNFSCRSKVIKFHAVIFGWIIMVFPVDQNDSILEEGGPNNGFVYKGLIWRAYRSRRRDF